MQRCKICAAVELVYASEVALKNSALQEFWKHNDLHVPLQPLVPSARGRAYRTVSKRKAFPSRGTVRLGLIEPSESGASRPFEAVRCAIEPAEHGAIYKKVQSDIEKPYAQPLAEEIRYVIVKGSYREFTVILTVCQLSAALAKAANTLSKSLTSECENILGVFLYEDDSNRRYYLGTKDIRSRLAFKKIFGKGTIYQHIMGKSFLYSPLSFSQVNQSIIESIITTAGEMLTLTATMKLFDLYCGYGLFSLCLADRVNAVVGVELSPQSVEAAIANAKRQKASHVRFLRSDITADSINNLMKHSRPEDAVLLDPPRHGTAPGVVECIASKRPSKVLHIFCNIDLIPGETARWLSNGYRLTKAIPFDMFPGTPDVEMLLLFERQ